MSTLNISEDKDFLCVEFPSIVKNPSKAIPMLGGIDSLTKALKNTETHPTLNFRFHDIYSKPIIGVKKERNIFIFKATESEDHCVKVDYIGRARNTFCFENLADMSFLPVERKQQNYESIENLLKLDSVDFEEMMARPAPLFMQPLTFFRPDKSIDYAYRYKVHEKKIYSASTKYIFYFGDVVPSQRPKEKVFDQFKLNCPRYYNEFEKCFKERVIWSSSQILARGVLKSHILRKYISGFAYSYKNGPWRGLWIRVGFDPTINPASKSFQLVEVRSGKYCQEASIRSKGGDMNLSRDSLPFISSKSTREPLGSATLDFSQDDRKSRKPLTVATKFVPGVLPDYYNNLFQVHSIEMEEVRDILHSNDGIEAECNFQDGWLVPGAVCRIREIVLADIRRTLNYQEKFSNPLADGHM